MSGCPVGVVDWSLTLAQAGDAYLASLRFDDAGARAAFDAVVDEALAVTAGDPFEVRALVRMLVFDLAQARSSPPVV